MYLALGLGAPDLGPWGLGAPGTSLLFRLHLPGVKGTLPSELWLCPPAQPLPAAHTQQGPQGLFTPDSHPMCHKACQRQGGAGRGTHHYPMGSLRPGPWSLPISQGLTREGSFYFFTFLNVCTEEGGCSLAPEDKKIPSHSGETPDLVGLEYGAGGRAEDATSRSASTSCLQDGSQGSSPSSWRP